MVDHVCVGNDGRPFECVKRIKPDIFAKGRSIKDFDANAPEKILKEEKELYFGASRIHETAGFSFSSSEIIENFLNIYPKEVKAFLKEFSRRYGFDSVREKINGLVGLKVLLIGDGIIDEYHYCESLGKSAKSNLVVNKYLAHEIFAGGAFAIANHLLGNDPERESFVRKSLKPNVKIKFFHREDSPTVTKKRYINQYLNQKMFEVNYLNENYINGRLESGIVEYLKTAIPHYDLVLVSDFGHGFITGKIIRSIEQYSVKFAVNTQVNAANYGYNMVTKYRRPAFVCLDEHELRLTAQERFADIEHVARKVREGIDAACLIVTLGKNGSLGINKNKELNRTPVFSSKVVDTVGAGDGFSAVFILGKLQGWPAEQTLARAHEFAAAICTLRGAIPVQANFYVPFLKAWRS